MLWLVSLGLSRMRIMVQSNFSQWREGSLETVAMTISPWSQAQSIRGNVSRISVVCAWAAFLNSYQGG
ncbi:hypothetical protein PsorP6_014806 [Peronosclerospora sorghi]|uniref:Uncharacterized protein n=1 Tax=Peronosclerospora sorghi TaxID=230839 RepID=A0ACC0VSS5_9STRA|nr:hypothetical protein PsorP6_014806 [Peronosclerospora sorghi]